MRAIRRHRPLDRAIVPAPPGIDLAQVASAARYVISPEHKDYLTEAGPAKLRSDATPCPRDINRETAEEWLKSAIAAGQVGRWPEEDDFPHYAWHRDGARVFEARLTNSGSGEYKGYPLDDTEWPEALR